MKSILPLTAAAVLSCGALMAQSTAPQNMPAQSPTTQAPAPTTPASQQAAATNQPKIAPGSVIPVQLTKTVDAKKVKTGDEVVAKVTMDMKTQTGQVLVPKDTKVIGHVTEAQARHKDEKESQLGIAFNEAVLSAFRWRIVWFSDGRTQFQHGLGAVTIAECAIRRRHGVRE